MNPPSSRTAFRVVDGQTPPTDGTVLSVPGMVRQGIAKAQEKLIDLSMRNSMLNFRHSEISARHVRIADEQIGLLVEALESGRALDLTPVPPVEQVPRDEDTEEFRSALKVAKEVDPEWLVAEDARRAAGNKRRSRDKAAERALRDRVRIQLNLPEWKVASDPKARAKELGLDPSYDLPLPSRNPPERHLDDALQTLHFPDRLEPKLSTIYSAARALQEDAGLSALHCAVGFLEWYDPIDAPDPAYAPLVLLPINMEKRVSQGDYVYSIRGRDDDEASNAALREKLKQLALDLPEYDPEEGVETYLSRVSQSLVNRPRWKVRRFVTIGLFSFSRQVMWADLDPTKWPATSHPESHPLLCQIYGDVAGEGSGSMAPVYDVDQPEMEQQAPALITDADSSQLSAVIDATSGKNLVIQGPPGTGKSQAITNIIANALWHGKTVLFVSEKMAALNVVKNRLDSMDLGHFCLEVHSAKASKSLVLKAIRERMENARERPDLQQIDSARSAFQENRQRLTDYAALINSPAGETGLTIHEVMWADFARTNLPEGMPPAVVDFRLPNPLSIDRFKLDELVGCGRALDALSASMGPFAQPRHQPWRGIGNLNLTRFDRVKAIQLVTAWAAELDQLHGFATTLVETTGWPKPSSHNDLEFIAAVARDIPDPPPNLNGAVLQLAVSADVRSALRRWADLALEADKHEQALAAVCDPVRLTEHRELSPSVVSRGRDLGVADRSLSDLKKLCNQAHNDSEAHSKIVRLVADVFTTICPLEEVDITARAEAMVTGYLHHILQLSSDRLSWCSLPLADENAIGALTHGGKLGAEINAAAAAAKFEDPATLDFANALPASTELRHAAATIRSASVWTKLFGRDWRIAKSVWRQTFPSDRKIVPGESSRRLQAAAIWKESIAKLEANEGIRFTAGRHWDGADTPFEELIAVAKWIKSIRDVTPLSEPGARELRRIACEGSSDEFALVVVFAETATEVGLMDAFKASYAARVSIKDNAAKLSRQAASLLELTKDAEVLGLLQEQPIAAIPPAVETLAELDNLTQAMAMLPNVAAIETLLDGSTRVGKARDVLKALDHLARVQSAKLSASVVSHLLDRDCVERTAVIKKLATEIQLGLLQEKTAANAAQEMLELRLNDWCGGALQEVSVEALRAKCHNAAQSPDQLEKQIDLLSSELDADRLGVGELLRKWADNGLAYSGVAWAIEAAYYRSAAEKLMRSNPVLARHAGNTHEQARTRFQQLDREIMMLNRKMIAAKLHGRPVPAGRRAQSVRDYTENEMLTHQTGLQQPRIALRRLFTNAGEAIRAYTPCIMMSPMSVAQYLEPGKNVFDLLVIDEASQMRPEDALGAMMRCHQAIIVGDPQQLPPTDFFTASNDGDGDEDDRPEESILELGRRCWHPMRMLEVHYRSRHQSLIAYSNREFYDERLLVYPSPVLEDPDYGVSCQRVAGIYETGQGRNRIEAEAVVDAAAELMRKRHDRSLGIVAINQAQRDLIETLMDQRVASDPELLAYRQKWDGQLEEFFIKNLENVQGDERDTILISTVYGKTDEGTFRQNFGPINRAYGHRRLNVLFTRAKRKLTVFTSLDHGQIVADGHSRGVRVLKEFLEYAQTGTISPGRRTGAEPDSDFERWFLTRLSAEGYEAHPQVGVAKYRIDIGIVHPDKQGSYILGVECDGATYHSSKSARDRDRLRQEVLESLNWNIHRVWSTDWYRNPEREFTKLVQSIENLRSRR